MRVICAWHKPEPKIIGEKCPACGQMYLDYDEDNDMIECTNQECEIDAFTVGMHETHTICPECRAEFLKGVQAKVLSATAEALQEEFDRMERR